LLQLLVVLPFVCVHCVKCGYLPPNVLQYRIHRDSVASEAGILKLCLH
jgi:hypothetical protein